MSTILHPFRSAPLIAPMGPPPDRTGFVFAVLFITAAGLITPSYLRGRDAFEDAARRTADAARIEVERESARAEQNARAWVRSAYGVDPWVRCDEGACDVVVGAAAPFRLACDTTPGGACRVRGGL